MTATTTQPQSANTPDKRPGLRSSEFWLSAIATLAGIVLASGALAEGSMAAQIVGGVLAVLAQLGYTASRTQVKREAAKQSGGGA